MPGRRRLDGLQRLGGEGGFAGAGEEQADPVGVAGVEEVSEGAELGFDGGAIAEEAEVVGGGFEAVEVEWEAGEVLVEEEGFDELEGEVGSGEEAGFEEGFAVFVGGDGVGDDATAYAHVGLVVVKDEGADGYAEGGGAVGSDVADGTGVDAAGVGFELADDLHSADLGSSGDGAAGEEGGEDVVEGGAGAEGGGDGGGHLVEGLVALDGEEVVDVDGAGERDAAEVVAEEVDDHDVLGAVLFVVLEREGDGVVFDEVEAAGHGALHGAGGDFVGVEVEEEFGGEREDVVGAEVEKGGVGYGLLRRECGEEGGGREGCGEGDGVGEVDLVGVAGGDVGFDFFDGGEVVGGGDAEGRVSEDGGGVRTGLGRERGWRSEEGAGGVVEEDGGGIGGEVGEREGVGACGFCRPTHPQVRVWMGLS